MPNENTIKDTKAKKAYIAVLEWIELFVFSLALVLFVMAFICRHSPVEGPSMENTLKQNDILIISSLFYSPDNDDIIVLYPYSDPVGYARPYVKRIIAKSGQTLYFENRIPYVDGVKRDIENNENIQHAEDMFAVYSTYTKDNPLTIPDGFVFVMGDNRGNSTDSRSIINENNGLIDVRNIIGKVVFRAWPLTKFGAVK